MVVHFLDDLALDDIDVCAGHAGWERRLFNLYNAIHASERWLLWSARAEPAFALPDLASRLKASLIYQVHELADAEKATVLRSRARGVGFAVMLGLLYAALYGLLLSEDNALVLGSGLLFAILAAIMVVTRKVDWYQVAARAPTPVRTDPTPDYTA